MSWSLHYENRENFEKDAPQYPAVPELGPDCEEQKNVARHAAEEIIASGAVGGEGKDFTVNISGHANPGHEPAAGWANDCITVSITQKS